MTSDFTVDRARATLAELHPMIDELIRLRADAAELAATVEQRGGSALGGLPELKAAQARLNEMFARIERAGVEIKGIAPLLFDFPSQLDGVPVLLCWLEGEPELAWYHRLDLGFLGRRPLDHE